MNPKYRFTLTIDGGTERNVFPVYGTNLTKEYAKESGEQFFRAKLSGELVFTGAEYALIRRAPLETLFGIIIYISLDAGASWAEYWRGEFWKTDCDFNDDDKTATVKPGVVDAYTAILAGIEKEYNLLDLLPEIVPISADKRPLLQIYVPGQTSIGCFLSGMWWEQPCEAVTNQNDLRDKYKFYQSLRARIIQISGDGVTPELPAFAVDNEPSTTGYFTVRAEADGIMYELTCQLVHYAPQEDELFYRIKRVSDGVILWSLKYQYLNPPIEPYSVTLNPVAGTGATGTVTLDVSITAVYARLMTDVVANNSYPIPSDDLVENNRNYSRITPIDMSGLIYMSANLSSEPTPWGLYQPGQYFAPPEDENVLKWYPVARNAWGDLSLWLAYSNWYFPAEWRQAFVVRDAFPLASVISVLLGKIAPGVTHEETTAYSEFLYTADENPITGTIGQRLFITPKSNIVTAGYDEPARKAPITLRDVLNMLRDCFRCYWFIEDGKFRIEHIKYFANGGTYEDVPVVGLDLTTAKVSRNGKSLAFATSKFNYDKPDTAGRYQFGWMDDTTELFDGLPIDIISRYVNEQNIEQITVSRFTSDFDYILLNPGEVSKDGFVLLVAVPAAGGGYELPFVEFTDSVGARYVLQNGLAAFAWLQEYYKWDMPAELYSIGGNGTNRAKGVKKLLSQNIQFPVLNDPAPMQLIKTNIGNGTIEKLSINLSSRNVNATLSYEPE